MSFMKKIWILFTAFLIGGFLVMATPGVPNIYGVAVVAFGVAILIVGLVVHLVMPGKRTKE